MEDRNKEKQNNTSSGLVISAFDEGEVRELALSDAAPEADGEVFINDLYLGLSKKLRVARFVLLFAIIIIALFTLMRFSSHINLYSIKEFFYSFREGEISLEADRTVISGADLVSARAFKNYLLMLRGDRAELYKADGTRYLTKRISMTNPTLEASNKYFLVYDLGGYDIKLYNTVDVIYEESFENTIYIADVNDKGYLAVLTHDVSYASQLLVYNEDRDKIFEWNSADKYTPCMRMLDDSQRIATASFSSDMGTAVTVFNLFDIKSDTPITHRFVDTLPLKLDEIGSGLYLLCSDKLIFFDGKGNVIKEHDIVSYGSTVTDAYCDGERLALVLEEEGYSYGSRLVLFNENGDVVLEREEKYEIPCVAVIKDELYYIHYGELVCADLKDKTEKRTSLTDSYSDILELSGRLVLVSETETLIFS